jgi:N-dimethylarginine dimethylaminohydrolase
VSSKNKLFTAGKILVCPPLSFEVIYEINPWMNLEVQPRKSRVLNQWQTLHHTLIRLGVWLEYIEPHQGTPDQVYTANAGLVRGRKVVLASFRHKERRLEEPHFRKWFEEKGYQIFSVAREGSFEGEGDALPAGDLLVAGTGIRSDAKANDKTAAILGYKDLLNVKLVAPHFYHLDTCFAYLGDERALVHKGAFDKRSFKLLEKYFELIVVTEHDAEKFACNSLLIGDNLVCPAGCKDLPRQLKKFSISCLPIELGEFKKGGGSAKCLTLWLENKGE